MRADLNKQLCERERRGHDKRYKEVRRSKKFSDPGEEGENLNAHESMTYRYGYETKDFNENLNPLYSQLRKAVGRPWDKFYSELCQNFDKRSVINAHILQHLYDRIAVNVEVRNGELWIMERYGGPTLLRKSSYTEYYVDPRDGIIKKNKAMETYRQSRRRQAEENEKKELEVTRWIDSYHVLRKIDDTWFFYELKDIPEGRVTYSKPLNQDLFKIYSYEKEGRPWDKLREYEKEKVGVPHFTGDSAFDVFYGERVYRMGRNTRAFSNLGSRFPRNELMNATKYHASKKTASHKELKLAGIIT
jgi:hypothetical protein